MRVPLILVLTWLLVGCAAPPPPSPTAAPTALAPTPESPTATATATTVPSPTPSPTPTPLAGALPLGPEQAGAVQLLGRLGRGGVNDMIFIGDGGAFAIISPVGVDSYSAAQELLAHIPLSDPDYALSPDGRYLAQRTGAVHEVALYDLLTGTRLHTLVHADPVPAAYAHPAYLTGTYERVFSLAFNHASTRLAVGYGDQTIELWDVERGSAERLQAVVPLTRRLAFSPDDRYLAASGVAELGGTRQLGIYDLQAGQAIYWHANEGYLPARPFSADSRYLLTLHRAVYALIAIDGIHSARLGVFPTGLELAQVEFAGDEQFVLVRAGGQTLVRETLSGKLVAGADPLALRQPDAPRPALGADQLRQLGYGDGYQRLALAGDRLLLVFESDAGLQVWDRLNPPVVLANQPLADSALADDQLLGCAAGTLTLYRLDPPAPVRELGPCTAGAAVGLAPGGQLLAVAERGGIVELRDPDRGAALLRPGATGNPTLRLALAPGGEYLLVATDAPVAAGPSKGELALYALEIGRGLYAKQALPITGEVTALAIAGDGAWFAVADLFTIAGEPHYGPTLSQYSSRPNPSQVRLFNRDGGVRFAWPLRATALAFAPDGQLLVVGEATGALLLIDPASGELLTTHADAHGLPIVDLLFSPDGRTLYALSQDGTVTIWGVE